MAWFGANQRLSWMASAILTANYFVSPTGSDAANGLTILTPKATLKAAHDLATAGQTILVRGGTFAVAASIQLTADGSAGNPIKVRAFPGETPVFDGATMVSTAYYGGAVIEMSSVRYFEISGLEIKNGPMWGLAMTGSTGDGTVRWCNVHHNGRLSGFEGKGIYVESTGANGIVLENDCHHNYDQVSGGGNADGIQVYARGAGWQVVRNRCWRNSDDGIDLFNLATSNTNVDTPPILVEGNWCWENGYVDEDGGAVTTRIGDGNGIKAGGQRAGSTTNDSGGHTIRFNLCWKNAADGIGMNNATIPSTITQNTCWSNGEAGFESQGTAAHIFQSNVDVASTNGATAFHANVVHSSNSWNGGVTATVADWLSTAYTLATARRGACGEMPYMDFLRLASGSDLINAGASGADMGAYER